MAIIARVILSVSLWHVGESLGNYGDFLQTLLQLYWALGVCLPSGFPLRAHPKNCYTFLFDLLHGATS